jgi:nucleoside-diphosphate-sugar epimerase
VLHVSTAYVAGTRRHGRVREDELDGSGGFLTGYEASKFRAEQLVREWSAAHGRPVTVFRPGVLTDHRPAPPGAPYSPHAVLAARLALLGRRRSGPLAARIGLSPEGVTEVPMPGDPEAHMNVLPVQNAADTMVLIARHPAAEGVTSYHVVHPQQTSVGSLLDALTYHAPWLRIRLTGNDSTPQGSAPGGELRDLLVRESAGVGLYAGLHRTYDRTRSAALGAPEPPELDAAYLRASFTPPAPR